MVSQSENATKHYMIDAIKKSEGARVDIEDHVTPMGKMTVQQSVVQLASNDRWRTTMAKIKITAHNCFPEDVIRGVAFMLVMRAENVGIGRTEPKPNIFVFRRPRNIRVCPVERTSQPKTRS